LPILRLVLFFNVIFYVFFFCGDVTIIWGCHAVQLGKYLQTFRSIAVPNAFVSAVKPFLDWLALKTKALGSIILRNFGKYWRSLTTHPHSNTAGKTSYIEKNRGALLAKFVIRNQPPPAKRLSSLCL